MDTAVNTATEIAGMPAANVIAFLLVFIIIAIAAGIGWFIRQWFKERDHQRAWEDSRDRRLMAKFDERDRQFIEALIDARADFERVHNAAITRMETLFTAEREMHKQVQREGNERLDRLAAQHTEIIEELRRFARTQMKLIDAFIWTHTHEPREASALRSQIENDDD